MLKHEKQFGHSNVSNNWGCQCRFRVCLPTFAWYKYRCSKNVLIEVIISCSMVRFCSSWCWRFMFVHCQMHTCSSIAFLIQSKQCLVVLRAFWETQNDVHTKRNHYIHLHYTCYLSELFLELLVRLGNFDLVSFGLLSTFWSAFLFICVDCLFIFGHLFSSFV